MLIFPQEQMHQTENVPPPAVSHQDPPPTNTRALDHYENRAADDHDALRSPVQGEAESDDGEVSMELATPLVALDVYEHAYFLDYRTDRASYIDRFFDNLDWTTVNDWVSSY